MNDLVKLIKILVCMLVFMFLVSSNTFAHPGKTDSNGGHKDSKNISGFGKYHYHHGNEAHLHNNGLCPFDNKNKQVIKTVENENLNEKKSENAENINDTKQRAKHE